MNIDDDILRKILIGIRDAKPISDAAERRETWDRCWREAEETPPYFDRPVRVGDRCVQVGA